MMFFGVDYYPEHWDSEMMEHDLARICQLGANTVRIGEFTWHMMEPKEGQYNFEYFDHVIEKIKSHGLKIIFGTPTATFPAWLANGYPDILSKDERGVQRAFGGRRQYCYNSRIYRQKTIGIVTELLKHYQNETEIVAWQIDNELGHEGSDQCYCSECHMDFQQFLKDKYKDILNLNETYGTIFWGQTYNDFSEIPMPVPTITTHNPSLQLDWARFRSESINDYAMLQIEIVKFYKNEHQKIIHNLFGGFFDRAYDQNVLAERLDVVAYDNYPVWGGLEKPISPANIAMTHDYIRGLKRENFWVVEELMGAQGHTVIGYLPRPNQAKMWSYQAMARGCESLLYFRYRGMTKGAEQFCQGILDQDNQINDKFREAQSFFEEVKYYEGLYQSPICPEVAVLYDYDNRWSWHYQSQSHAFDFTNELLRLYEGFYNHNISIDVIDVKKDFSQYKIIALPVMQIIDEALLKRLEDFAQSGGQILFSFRSGIKDKDNNLRLSSNILEKLTGVAFKNYESLGLLETVMVKGVCSLALETAEIKVWRDLLVPTTAEPIYIYQDQFFDQYVAVSQNSVGAGKVYYIGGGLSEDAITHLYSKLLRKANIQTYVSEKDLEVVMRNDADQKYLLLMNHSDEIKRYMDHVIPPYGSKIVAL